MGDFLLVYAFDVGICGELVKHTLGWRLLLFVVCSSNQGSDHNIVFPPGLFKLCILLSAHQGGGVHFLYLCIWCQNHLHK